LHVQGWYTINAMSIPVVLLALAAALWVARIRARTAQRPV
jgi:hypothetical protein